MNCGRRFLLHAQQMSTLRKGDGRTEILLNREEFLSLWDNLHVQRALTEALQLR